MAVLIAASEPVQASSKWLSGGSGVQNVTRVLLRWQSSSAWSITKPKLTSLKSWLSKLPVVQIIAEQLITWSELEKAERAIDKLIGYFDGCGYSTAATYIRRAKYGMFGYIRRWLKWELISSRSSSMVGIVMRKPGRRFSLTACGWSDKGVTKIARIILNDLQMPENGWIAG